MQKARTTYKYYFQLAGFLIASLYSMEGGSMSSLFGTEVVLFSPMEGKMTYEGKPAANAKITRLIIWKGDEGETDTFYTDENGGFKLPVKKGKVRIPVLGEFRIAQEIYVFYKDEKIPIWAKSKIDLNEYGELGGKPINLRCELTDELVLLDNFNGLFGTSCKWDTLEKQGEN